MCERYETIFFQTIFKDVFDFPFKMIFVKNEKNRQIWFKLSLTYDSTIRFANFEAFFLKIIILKKFYAKEDSFSMGGGSITRAYTKNIYYLTIAIINRCFEF